MMTGTGPFGGMEMGGMYATVNVRKGQARGDYQDPGWYQHPAGTVAHEWQGGAAGVPAAQQAPGTAAAALKPGEQGLKIRKGSGHGSH